MNAQELRDTFKWLVDTTPDQDDDVDVWVHMQRLQKAGRTLLAEVARLTAAEQAASEANYTFSFDLMQMTAEVKRLEDGWRKCHEELDTVAAANARLAAERDALAGQLQQAQAQLGRLRDEAWLLRGDSTPHPEHV